MDHDEDVGTSICRVPASSVKQLRSTCKGWNRLFNDKRIIRKHFDKAPKQFMVLMLLSNSFTILPMSIIHLNGTPSVKRKREVGLLDPHHNNSYRFHIYQVFHCDGLLLCASHMESRFLVWNPLNNQSIWTQFKKRPKPERVPKRPLLVKRTKTSWCDMVLLYFRYW